MDYYKPKIMLNEPQMNFNIYKDVDYETINPVSPYSMFYSIKVANDLKSFYEKSKTYSTNKFEKKLFTIGLLIRTASILFFYLLKVIIVIIVIIGIIVIIIMVLV